VIPLRIIWWLHGIVKDQGPWVDGLGPRPFSHPNEPLYNFIYISCHIVIKCHVVCVGVESYVKTLVAMEVMGSNPVESITIDIH
jgi:hypothetical protein